MNVRSAKSPTSAVSLREQQRRCVKLQQYSTIVNGESCTKSGLLLAAAYSTNVRTMTCMLKNVSVCKQAANKLVSDDMLPASTHDAAIKSVKTLYCCGIMSKKKYQSQIKVETESLKQSSVPTKSIPRLLPYVRVQKFVGDIPKPTSSIRGAFRTRF